jgi:hypothetical protein
MVKVTQFLFLISAVALSARSADETTARLDRAAAVFAKLTTATHGIRSEQIDSLTASLWFPGSRRAQP